MYLTFLPYRQVRRWCLILLLSCPLCANAMAGDLPDTVAKIKPSIVGVGTYQRTRQPAVSLRGTGFVVADGRHVLTNLHVIPKVIHTRRKETLAIFAGTGEDPDVRLAVEVAADAVHDLVLLKFSDAPLPALKLGDSDKVREGERYAFTGFPIGAVLGLYPVTHRGIVSSITPEIIPLDNSRELNAAMLSKLRHPYMVFQLDATAYPGNSGSPLYNPDTGAVIGIVNKVFVQETKENVLQKPSGISYAIPIRYARALLAKAGLKDSM
ncbi:MAG: serine protease [Gammaproteobacteria bacterium]|jgi:serine protease Do